MTHISFRSSGKIFNFSEFPIHHPETRESGSQPTKFLHVIRDIKPSRIYRDIVDVSSHSRVSFDSTGYFSFGHPPFTLTCYGRKLGEMRTCINSGF